MLYADDIKKKHNQITALKSFEQKKNVSKFTHTFVDFVKKFMI